jgi:hypothetical protein
VLVTFSERGDVPTREDEESRRPLSCVERDEDERPHPGFKQEPIRFKGRVDPGLHIANEVW